MSHNASGRWLQGYTRYSLGADAQPGGEGNNAGIGYLPDEPERQAQPQRDNAQAAIPLLMFR